MSKRRRAKARRRIWRAVIFLIAVIALFVSVLPKLHEKISYPVVYREWIEEFSNFYDLDPALVAAIVHTESGYDTNATSSVGARGLMQVMPSTAEWIHPKLDKPYAFDAEALYTVDGALTYGCWYLNFLMNRYGADTLSVIAAYHAGQGNVDSWRKETEFSHDGIHLDKIPENARATRHYVEKVRRAYEYYQKVYETGI